MTKVSASTLARQAAKTKNVAEAKRLRAKAAKLRREQRLADAAGLKHTKGLEAGFKPRPMTGLGKQTINRALTSVDQMPLTSMVNQEQPGHGEIVGGYLAHMAKGIADLARKKGGVDAIQSRLSTLEHQTWHDAMFDARQREQKAVKAVREEMRDKAVCGFIAKFDASEAINGVPSAAIMSSEEIRNLIDALKANGYTAAGKR